MTNPEIKGFRDQPEKTPSGADYVGRLSCDDVQITGKGPDTIATFTITARQLLDAVSGGMLWTDQDVQRGIRPEISRRVDRELNLASGYPDSSIYVFNAESADEMAFKLLRGQRLFVNPLVWNLRPGSFDAYYDHVNRKIFIYDGKIYLPDSHHRHQAILKAAQIYKQAPSEYPHFDLGKQFKVELYFLKKADEGNYFFDKNQLPTPTAKSKAYDLTSEDDLSVLAKRVIELTPTFHANVNRVTDRLTAKNANVVTLSTLREMLKTAAEGEALDETAIEGFAHVAAQFFAILVQIRPELGVLGLTERNKVRATSLVDAPIMFQGYGGLISDFNLSVSKEGMNEALREWTIKLNNLAPSAIFYEGNWRGDFFQKINPLWHRLGIIKPGLTGNPTVSNNRAARLQVIKALRFVTSAPSDSRDLGELVR
jgi:hypothetical protein